YPASWRSDGYHAGLTVVYGMSLATTVWRHRSSFSHYTRCSGSKYLISKMPQPGHQRISKDIWGSSTALKTSQDTLWAIEPSHIRIRNASGMSRRRPADSPVSGHRQ